MSFIKTKRGRWAARAAGALSLAVLPTLALAGTAQAASCVAFTGSTDWNVEKEHWTWWNGSLRSPGHAGESYASVEGWHGTFDRELWKGPIYRCPTDVVGCDYAWGSSKSTTTQWSINVSIDGTLKAFKAFESAIKVTPGYQRSTTYTESFTRTVKLNPGQYAQPYMASRMERQSGFIRGAYKSPGDNGTQCRGRATAGIGFAGYSSDWDPTGVVSRWNANVRLWDFSSYYTWY